MGRGQVSRVEGDMSRISLERLDGRVDCQLRQRRWVAWVWLLSAAAALDAVIGDGTAVGRKLTGDADPSDPVRRSAMAPGQALVPDV